MDGVAEEMDRLMVWLAHHWQQKLMALVAACSIWLIMNHSITTTCVIPNVALRVVNLPSDKTVNDLLPTGYLARRLNLTVTGTKGVVENLQPEDLEVVIDAKDKGDEWIVQLSRKNLVAHDPEIDLYRVVSQVSHGEFILKLSRRVTKKIPVRILPARGEPPSGYQFLDVWPQMLHHTVTGAEEIVSKLEMREIDLVFDLSTISQEELDALTSTDNKLRRDEVRFFVPESWKMIEIPFYGKERQAINDVAAKNLHIDFLRKELLPVDWDLPLRIYYPEKTSDQINPGTHTILPSPLAIERNHLLFLNLNLYVKDVSRLFLDMVRGFVELTAVASPNPERGTLEWGVQFINPAKLEESYVKELIQSESLDSDKWFKRDLASREQFFRHRFREYMQKFTLFHAENRPLTLELRLEKGGLSLQEPYSSFPLIDAAKEP
ncbi:MAG: hypothetical protein K0S07_545 [Chlamydiales bacterium]|jgi:hypothetical protein|nr:hypothetical protein [Chlamydiales bacterium]